MKKLLKDYGFNSDMQYFEMICDSFTNGQRTQAAEQFKAMPKCNKISMLKSITVGGWDSQLSNNDIMRLFDAI